MEENIAVSKKKQKSFQLSVDKYKQLLKSGELEINENETPQEIAEKKKKARGIVYLSNIPHGFYEEQMKEYFKQFGLVTRIRLARSKKTGKSKGFAFIEFAIPDVAQIVAETMNNYLMCKRLLKAKYIPPDEQHDFYFKGKNWTETFYPKVLNRKKNILRENTSKTDKQALDMAKKHLKDLDKIKSKLLEVGIIYNFEPIDIPPELTLNYKNNSQKETSPSDSDSEPAPTLYLHESDDSDIIFNVPSDYKTVIVPKEKGDNSPKQKKLNKKQTKINLDDKKSGGINKKNKKNRPLLFSNKDTKKIKLIQSSLKDDTQVKLRKKNKK